MRKLLVLLFLLQIGVVAAQERVGIGIYQDARLGLVGDDKGNDAGTLDIIVRVVMQGNQQKWGYMIVYPEFEYAEIDGNYKRWSANVGYVFNKLIVNNLEASIAGSWGWIDRYSLTSRSWGGNLGLMYKLNDWLKVGVQYQLVQRSDMVWMYGYSDIEPSWFGSKDVHGSGSFGLEFNF